MKPYLFTLSIFLILFSNAQTTSVLKGEEFDHPKKFKFSHVVEQDADAHYFFESAGPFPDEICLFYKVGLRDGKVLFSKEINFEKRVEFVAAYNKNGKIFLFTKYRDNKQDILFFLLRTFNSKTGEEIGETRGVAELSLEKGKSVERDFEAKFSPDEGKMLIVTEERGKKTAPDITAKLYDTGGFKLIWEKKAVNIFENSPVYTFNYLVGNDGIFSYLFAFYRSNSETDIGYGIGLIPTNNYQNKMIKIPAANLTILNPKLEYVNNELVCSGEFFEGQDKTKKTKDITGMGFFFVGIDLKSIEITTQSYDLLNEDLKTKLTYPDKNIYYNVTGVSATSFANKNYRHYQTLALNGNYYVIKHHSYILILNGVPTITNREIIVMKYNNEKKLEWMKLIPRNIYTMGTISSQLNITYSNKLNFFYHEHPDNQATKEYNPKKYKLIKEPTEKTLVITTLDDKGEMKKVAIPTESTFYLNEEFEKTIVKDAGSLLGRSDTKSKKTRRYDIITLND